MNDSQSTQVPIVSTCYYCREQLPYDLYDLVQSMCNTCTSVSFIVQYGNDAPRMENINTLIGRIGQFLLGRAYGYSDANEDTPTIWLWRGYSAPAPLELVTVSLSSATPYDENDYAQETWRLTTRSQAVSLYVTIQIDGRV